MLFVFVYVACPSQKFLKFTNKRSTEVVMAADIVLYRQTLATLMVEYCASFEEPGPAARC